MFLTNILLMDTEMLQGEQESLADQVLRMVGGEEAERGEQQEAS